MRYNITDERLKMIVDELGEEYKDLLIANVLDNSSETDIELINISDVIRLDVNTKANLRSTKKYRRANRINTMVSLVGVMYALVGLVMLMLGELAENRTMMIMSLLLLFIGIFVALFSILIANFARNRLNNNSSRHKEMDPIEIVNRWKLIEALIHELMPNDEALLFSDVLDVLVDTKMVSEDDVSIINRILFLRNHIVHNPGSKINASQTELKEILRQADKLIAKLKKFV